MAANAAGNDFSKPESEPTASRKRRARKSKAASAPAAPAPDPQTQRLDASRRFAIAAAQLAADTHCHNVVLLQVTGLSPVTDFFLLANGTSARQMRTVCEEIEELAASHDYRPLTRSGYEGQSWMLTDYVDVVVHVFNDETRPYYDLDNLWGDAPRVEWGRSAVAAGR